MKTDCAPFIRFMLGCIHEALQEITPQDTPQVMRLLEALAAGALGREVLQQRMELSDRKSFRQTWLAPALASGMIEMTLPDKPNSRRQQYRLTAKGQFWLQTRKRSKT